MQSIFFKTYTMLSKFISIFVFTISTTVLFSQNEEILNVVQDYPRFPGCEHIVNNDTERSACSKRKMLEYIYSNLEYPAEARKNDIQGQVVAQFVIEKDGSISNINLLRDIAGGCGQATIDVIKSMNDNNINWIPGKQNGELVRVKYTLPVKFKL